MQLYAYDHAGSIIFSCKAQKKINYCCMECGSAVRLREGPLRHPHFFHLKKMLNCRQNGKGEIHIQLQIFIKKIIPDVFLEYRFQEIKRIADVVWHSQKIVFEIQCSPMTQEEMLLRRSDYRKAGYQMVLILHDSRYNQWRLTAMEMALHSGPHYYTNWNERGTGIIYDQWSHSENGLRKKILPPLPIDLTKPYVKENLGFDGDIHSLPKDHAYIRKIGEHEAAIASTKRKKVFSNLMDSLKNGAKKAYRTLLKSYCEG